MFKKYILFSQINISPNHYDEVIETWHQIFDSDKHKYILYINDEYNNLLMITTSEKSSDVFDEINSSGIIEFEKNICEHMYSDWRHQILIHEDSIIPFDISSPLSPFLQLRHIEVPLRVYPQYLAWRKGTIFEHVKQQDEIDYFLSYHSVLSTEPGVMFLSGFSCAPDDYLNLFNNEKYKKIVQEAGHKYISGGKKGLYTSLYRLSTNQNMRR